MRTIIMMTALLCLSATVANAQRAFHAEDLERALRGLEQGIEALAVLEKPELHAELERLADQVRRALEQAHAQRAEPGAEAQPISREVATARLETLRFAIPALRDAGRGDATELLERAARVYALALEGHEAQMREVSQRAPRHEQQIELLALAERMYRESDRPDRAEQLRAMIGKFWHRAEAPPRKERVDEPRRIVERRVERRGDVEFVREVERIGDREVVREVEREIRDDRNDARQTVERQLDILRTALHAFREAERTEAIRAMEHIIHARELELTGRDGPDARRIRETAPNLGGQVELLTLAAKLWDEFGHESKAGQLRELAAHYRQALERERSQAHSAQPARERDAVPPREMSEREQQLLQRIERLEATMREVVAALRALRHEREER